MKVKDFIAYLQRECDPEKHIVVYDTEAAFAAPIVFCKHDGADFYLISPPIEGLVTIAQEIPEAKDLN